jgi:hypothetical protein
MIRLCSSKIVLGIFVVGFVGSLVIGARYFDFYLRGMARVVIDDGRESKLVV